MMDFIRSTDIDFMGARRWAYLASSVLIVSGLVSLAAHKGLRYDVDFQGGTLLQISFRRPVAVEHVRAALAPAGFSRARIQLSHDARAGSMPEIMIEVAGSEDRAEMARSIVAALRASFGDSFEVRRETSVSPRIGGEQRREAVLAVMCSLAVILFYLSWRFHFRYAVAAVIALAHDVLVTLGMVSLTGREISPPVIAAFLTLIGYSVNDTIVVFDRIRETLRLSPAPFPRLVNSSVNRTLSRTLITSGTTLAVVAVLFLLGGEVLHDFAFVLLVGISVGTYSSVWVAGSILVDWEKARPRASVGGHLKKAA